MHHFGGLRSYTASASPFVDLSRGPTLPPSAVPRPSFFLPSSPSFLLCPPIGSQSTPHPGSAVYLESDGETQGRHVKFRVKLPGRDDFAGHVDDTSRARLHRDPCGVCYAPPLPPPHPPLCGGWLWEALGAATRFSDLSLRELTGASRRAGSVEGPGTFLPPLHPLHRVRPGFRGGEGASALKESRRSAGLSWSPVLTAACLPSPFAG